MWSHLDLLFYVWRGPNSIFACLCSHHVLYSSIWCLMFWVFCSSSQTYFTVFLFYGFSSSRPTTTCIFPLTVAMDGYTCRCTNANQKGGSFHDICLCGQYAHEGCTLGCLGCRTRITPTIWESFGQNLEQTQAGWTPKWKHPKLNSKFVLSTSK